MKFWKFKNDAKTLYSDFSFFFKKEREIESQLVDHYQIADNFKEYFLVENFLSGK